MMPDTFGMMVEELWKLYCSILKCLILSIVIPAAFISRRVSQLCASALIFVSDWEPMRPAIFGIPVRTHDD